MEAFEEIKRNILTDCDKCTISRNVKVEQSLDTLSERLRGEDVLEPSLENSGLNALLDFHTDFVTVIFMENLGALMCLPDNPEPIKKRLKEFFLSQTKLYILSAYIAEYEGGSKEKESADALNQLAQEAYEKYALLFKHREIH